MSESARRELALRKELLLARSSLYRLKIQGEIETVRRSLTWSQVGSAIVGAGPVRSLAFNIAVDIVGRDRVARLIELAGRALAVVRLAVTAFGLYRETTRGPQAGAEGDSARRP